ncbi:ADP-ribosylglycohydrolase family protein, partial [Kineosporia mesophila]|nr:ADP-ribosylglycohydrolase family protein [Kineosporia mesophila]
MTALAEHAIASLTGLALGDALGMPTQSMSPAAIAEDYGVISGLIDAGPRQRIAAGMSAGSITDDTEQAVLVAELLIRGQGRIDPGLFAHALLEWERRMAAKGSLDLLGPSTKMAVQRILDGVPVEEAGSGGTTNGAAMRIAPVGIAFRHQNLDVFVDAVHDACRLTHDTGLGVAGAAAVAAAVSAGLDGSPRSEALDRACAAAEIGARRGHWIAGADIAARLRWIRGLLPELTPPEQLRTIRDVVGTSVASQESVVAALALVALDHDPYPTLCLAAGLGGDTDTVAAMAGAVLGAVHGAQAWPPDAVLH